MEKNCRKEKGAKQEISILSVFEIEAIYNKETLKSLPSFVEEMDENLAININDFLKNKVFECLKFDKQNIIDIVKLSKKLHYDNKSQMIKFKEKADRNIIIFKNIIENEENVIDKCELIKNAIGNLSKCLISKLKGIDKVDKNLFFIFDNEDHTQEIEKQINSSLKNKEKDFEKIEFTLAAESLKRRINPFINYSLNLEEQKELIISILNNPTPFIPRRFTVGNKKQSMSKKLSNNRDNNIKEQFDYSEEVIDKTNNAYFEKGNQNKNNKIDKSNHKSFKKSNNNQRTNNFKINHERSYFNDNNNTYLNIQNFDSTYIGSHTNNVIPHQNINLNSSHLNPNNISNNVNLNKTFSFSHNYAYMKGYINAINTYNILQKNFYNTLLLQQKNKSININKQKSVSSNYNPDLINKFNEKNNNNNNKILNKSTYEVSVLNKNSINNIDKTSLINQTVCENIISDSFKNENNRKNIEQNIGRRSPSLKKLDISNADYYYNLLSIRNLNNSSMINNPNNSTLVNISLADNELNNTHSDVNVKSYIKEFNGNNKKPNYIEKNSNLNLSVVKENNENELLHENNHNISEININTRDKNTKSIDNNNEIDMHKKPKDYLNSNRNSIALNFAKFNPANFYNLNTNIKSNNDNINNNDYFYGLNNTPINHKNNSNRHGSISSLNLNFSSSNKRASVFSNDGYLINSLIQNTTNNPMYNNSNFNNNNQTNESYFNVNDVDNVFNNNYQETKRKSKTFYNKNHNINNNNVEYDKINLQKLGFNNNANNFNTKPSISVNNLNTTNANEIGNISNTDYLDFSRKQSFIYPIRQSKLSNINNSENLYSSNKKMSFLSFGNEINLIKEFNKNMKFIPQQSRKSSLNFLSMLKSQDLSKYRNSAFSIENDLGILNLEYQNIEEKANDISLQYQTNDIISVYFHMNYLKLFEIPHEFKNENFIEGIMSKEVKGNIEKLKEKKIIINEKRKSNNQFRKSITMKNRHNSISKIRLSQNSNSYQLMSLVEDNLDQGKNKRNRYCSVKI